MNFSVNNYNNLNISKIHKINPTIKFILFIIFMVGIFCSSSQLSNAVLILLTIFFWIFSKQNWKKTKILIFSAFIIFALILLVNWLSFKNPGMIVFSNNKNNLFFNIFKFNNEFIISGSAIPQQLNNLEWFIGKSWGMKIDNYIHVYQGLDFQQFSEAIKNYNATNNFSNFTYEFMKINGVDSYLSISYSAVWYSLNLQIIFYSINITIKIILMIMLITILISTTTNIEMTYAIRNILLPLKIFRFPIEVWAMIISLSIRFVPSLLLEAEKILRAQASRGVDFNSGNSITKFRALTSLFIPMFMISFLKSNDLSNTMEVRCYDPSKARTSYRVFALKFIDLFFLIFFTIVLIFLICFVLNNNFLWIFTYPDLLLKYGR